MKILSIAALKEQAEVVILSTNDPVGVLKTAAVHALSIQPVLGGYCGMYEQSFVMSARDYYSGLFDEFIQDQESVLVITALKGTGTRSAYLLYLGMFSDDPVYIGELSPVPIPQAIAAIENGEGATIDVRAEVGFIVTNDKDNTDNTPQAS